MSTKQYFEEVLGAKLRNSRWSWGAVNPDTGDAFIRVWKDQVRRINGADHVMVYYVGKRDTRPGSKERRRHLARADAGFRIFGVMCEAVDEDAVPRRIASFDAENLLVLGEHVSDEYEAVTWARIEGTVGVPDLPDTPVTREEASDIAKIKAPTKTMREALVSARIGQGNFRKQVLKGWNKRCAVTGCRTLTAVRASHIKPWRICTNNERLDPTNGLPLVAHLDALFDVGLITFGPSGRLVASKQLPKRDCRILLGDDPSKLKLKNVPAEATRAHLEWHRTNLFQL